MSVSSDIEITVDPPPEIEITVEAAAVEITVDPPPELEITVGESTPIEIMVETPPVHEVSVSAPPVHEIAIAPPPTVEIHVDWEGPPGPAGPPGGDGPQGPPGPTVVSLDAGNVATLGTDGYIFVPEQDGGGGPPAPHEHPEYLTEDEGDALFLTPVEGDTRYVNVTGDKMTGTLEVPDLKISEGADPGLVWTAEAADGTGGWQEPSSLVVAETSDPVLINWFDQSDEGWVKYSGTGSLVFTEMDSPSMPGVLDCTGDVWAEWTFGTPMVFEPGALYRMTVRVRMDAPGRLSFGLQGYDANTPATVVDTDNLHTLLKPHWCAKDLAAEDAAYVDEANPGEWKAWTGYVSGFTDDAAENLPPFDPIPPDWPPDWPASCSPAEHAVKVAAGVKQWRPVFHATSGHVWIDAIEVHRLDRSLELPGGIRASDVYANSVNANTVTTTDLIMPPSTTGYVLTATSPDGDSEWQYPPIIATEGVPRSNLLTANQETLADGTTGWGHASGCTLGVSPFGEDHPTCLRLTSTIASGSVACYTPLNTSFGTPVPASPNKTYTASAIYAGGNASGRIQIDFRDVAGARITVVIGETLPPAAGPVRTSVTAVAPANTVSVAIGLVGDVTAVGQHVNFDDVFLWEGTGPSEAPDNPLAVNLGTLHKRHGGSLASRTSAVTITSTVATTRVPGSLALQWTQTVPAMVTVRAATYLGQAANSTISIYFNVGVEDGNGAKLLTDSFGVPTTTAGVGGTAFRSAAGGLTYVPGVANWRRYLPPGTYMAYPVAWCTSIDAGSAKSVGVTYLELEIDPDMTNLPGAS